MKSRDRPRSEVYINRVKSRNPAAPPPHQNFIHINRGKYSFRNFSVPVSFSMTACLLLYTFPMARAACLKYASELIKESVRLMYEGTLGELRISSVNNLSLYLWHSPASAAQRCRSCLPCLIF